MPETHGLVVRRFKRHDVALDAAMCVAPEHMGLVRFSATSGARDGAIDVVLVDASDGGLGLMSPVFIPKRTIVRVTARSPMGKSDKPLLDTYVQIRRVVMTDRRPAYLLGGSFANFNDDRRAEFERFMAILDGEVEGAGAESAAGPAADENGGDGAC